MVVCQRRLQSVCAHGREENTSVVLDHRLVSLNDEATRSHGARVGDKSLQAGRPRLTGQPPRKSPRVIDAALDLETRQRVEDLSTPVRAFVPEVETLLSPEK